MALQQLVCNDSTPPLAGDIVAMSGQHMGGVKAQATSATVNILGAWVVPSLPGYPGTYDSNTTGINTSQTPVFVLGSSTSGINTTVNLYLGVTYKSAASTTTSTFQQVIVEHIR